MLSFAEILDVLMKQHNCKAVDICAKLGISKSYFSRLKNGIISPKNYLLVQELSEALELPIHEKQMLINAYKYTKLGEDFLKTEASVEQLYNMKFPVFQKNADNISSNSRDDVIIGIENVAEAVAALINSSMHTNCLFIPENKMFCNLLREISVKKSHISWLIYLEDCDQSQYNISVFNETISFLLAHQAETRYIYKSADEYYQCTPFPYIYISENEMLLIERSCEKAFRLKKRELIEVYREKLRSQFEAALPFAMMLTGFEDYLENWELLFGNADTPNSDDLLIVEKFPCIIHEATHSDISLHISDTENNDRLARIYLEFLKWSAKRLRKQEMLFTVEGIREYFSADEFHEYSKHLTKSIPKALRRELFGRLIELSKISNGLSPKIMNDFPFTQSSIRVINIWKSGIVLVIFDFEDAFRIVIMQEKTIASVMWNYFHSLKICEAILSKKETIEIMEREFHNEIKKLREEQT